MTKAKAATLAKAYAPRELYQDAFQEALIGGWIAETRRRPGESILAYETQLARGRILDFVRKQGLGRAYQAAVRQGLAHELEPLYDDMLVAAAPQQDLAQAAEIRSTVERTLQGKQLAIVRGYYLEERGMEEVGREVGVKIARACQIRNDALARLRAAMVPQEQMAA